MCWCQVTILSTESASKEVTHYAYMRHGPDPRNKRGVSLSHGVDGLGFASKSSCSKNMYDKPVDTDSLSLGPSSKSHRGFSPVGLAVTNLSSSSSSMFMHHPGTVSLENVQSRRGLEPFASASALSSLTLARLAVTSNRSNLTYASISDEIRRSGSAGSGAI